MQLNKLNESEIKISKELKYHLDRDISLNENVFHIGSKKYVDLVVEAAELNSKGILSLNEDELFLAETVGSYGEYRGEIVPLNIPFVLHDFEDNSKESIFGVFVEYTGKVKRVIFTKTNNEYLVTEYALNNDIEVLNDFFDSL